MSAERATHTVSEVAKILGVGRSTTYEAINRGEIPHLRLGNRIVIPRAGIESLLSGDASNDQSPSASDEELRAV